MGARTNTPWPRRPFTSHRRAAVPALQPDRGDQPAPARRSAPAQRLPSGSVAPRRHVLQSACQATRGPIRAVSRVCRRRQRAGGRGQGLGRCRCRRRRIRFGSTRRRRFSTRIRVAAALACAVLIAIAATWSVCTPSKPTLSPRPALAARPAAPPPLRHPRAGTQRHLPVGLRPVKEDNQRHPPSVTTASTPTVGPSVPHAPPTDARPPGSSWTMPPTRWPARRTAARLTRCVSSPVLAGHTAAGAGGLSPAERNRCVPPRRKPLPIRWRRNPMAPCAGSRPRPSSAASAARRERCCAYPWWATRVGDVPPTVTLADPRKRSVPPPRRPARRRRRSRRVVQRRGQARVRPDQQ